MNSKNYIIVINGKGGVGKDTLISSFSDLMQNEVKVKNISAITLVKLAAANYFGWCGGKEDRDRKFLADLRSLIEEYNDSCMEYLKKQTYEYFFENSRSNSGKDNVMFVHIREPENIERYIAWIQSCSHFDEYKVNTLLVLGKEDDKIQHGNESDDNVRNYNYDAVYENNKSKTEAGFDFTLWLQENILS